MLLDLICLLRIVFIFWLSSSIILEYNLFIYSELPTFVIVVVLLLLFCDTKIFVYESEINFLFLETSVGRIILFYFLSGMLLGDKYQ